MFIGLVNYGTQAGCIAVALRRKGVHAKSHTIYDKYRRPTDYEFRRANGLLGKVWTYLVANPLIRAVCFFRYDTFHFFYGKTLLPFQFDLPFYRIFGKTVVMEYLGWEAQMAADSIEKYKYTNARFYKHRSSQEHRRDDERKSRRLKRERNYCNATLVCAPYLSEFVPHAQLLPLAIDESAIEKAGKQYPDDRPLKIMHAPTSTGNKGTAIFEAALDELAQNGYKFEYARVQGVSHGALQQAYREADIFVDQLVSGWYGTASIEAMAKGCPTVCFLRESYAEYCPYFDDIPIINANPENVYEKLRDVLDGRVDLSSVSERSIEFVKSVHSADVVVDKLLGILENARD